jgi:FtsZ-binding cell division protein ZapB|tara:strand:- start:3884 stop:4171 length:288 start_codon:yes stop_codon:yes gene_type:complete
MSRSIDNIVLLESNVNKLKSLIVKLKTENSKIVNELNLKDESLVKKSDELKDWKEKYRSLKMANTFLGSNDKSLTKLKINNLIKELDKCILNLNS